MRLVRRASYRRMPWANGRGVTEEILRIDRAEGMLWRLSLAAVVENGPFSAFPGIERNLTVIEGPGFDLVGPEGRRRAALFQPVGFSGDEAIVAEVVTGPSRDFNVMSARSLGAPVVEVVEAGAEVVAGPGPLCLFALDWTGLETPRQDALLERWDVALVDPGHAVRLEGPGNVLIARIGN